MIYDFSLGVKGVIASLGVKGVRAECAACISFFQCFVILSGVYGVEGSSHKTIIKMFRLIDPSTTLRVTETA